MQDNETGSTPTQNSISLGRKLTSIIALGLVVTMAVLVWIAISQERAGREATFAENAALVSELFAQEAAGAIKFKKTDQLLPKFEGLSERLGASVEWVAALDATGAVIVGTELTPENPGIFEESWAEAAETGAQVQSEFGILQPVFFGKKNSLIGGVAIRWSDVTLQAQIRDMAKVTIMFGITVALAVLAVCFFWMRRIVVKPIQAIDGVMADLAKGNIDISVPEQRRGDEIGGMARSADAFRQSIERANREQEAQRAKEVASHAAEQQMLVDLEESIGAVVTAAREGHFNQRVDRTFDHEVINGICTGVNEICANISNFLDDCELSMAALAEGDLTKTIARDHAGRFGDMRNLINGSLSELSGLISNIRATGTDLSETISVVTQGSVDLSAQAESQAASLEETAASMEDMTSLVQQNNDRAIAIASQTLTAQQRAEKGQEVVSSAVGAMEEIEQGSSRITEIISVIDGIAFQTNLLSLNAAVEAARAGAAGKGFAVVAAEVRTLAQSSSDAANDIKELILASQSKVRDGASLVRATGDELATIIDSIKTVSAQIAEISDATQEQSLGVTEISTVISHLDIATQKNAVNAERSASSAKMLARKATDLQDLVARFNSATDKEAATDRAA